ncbi:MAG: glycine cleavage system protein H [Candidatus Infernicultor aquiphilus]|uniref:Glycine cleavage system H protein n=1 Tax=Candidatus Infernicultor aquiphilus TaxID=1805029 RepID=A0A1J5GAE7_9BACT|nr:glycine cleavage system protein GcvH [bacterium]OIP69268.1 MAG: glycine cleavage system protein H [Candidatus Atribacteria bacterium CG2_30_33_13]PIU25749.1 MAG: glycine cleavage system protein H [Candidatus Atribacteria bacterium CG08_land_8_20_14_0_20_33_29]PIW11412.1 MAG: glycine cleavage system protein H [Candidatus Atribacteria bacterium CG17_big_fil_post_rev_8_21_14_2_50_34_11]PIX33542.1 MAG: glycine cleavage system protein H [Candidatus Atribacteria bacterium CG_4_8_14_3_um_filter_34_
MTNKVIKNLYYTKSDEWLKVEDDMGTVGITDYAQDQLGDIVYLEKIKKGKKLKQGEALTTIESVKAVSDVNTPVSGEVIEVNEKVMEDTSIINKEPYGEGWIAKINIDNKDELKKLMNNQEYSEYRKE